MIIEGSGAVTFRPAIFCCFPDGARFIIGSVAHGPRAKAVSRRELRIDERFAEVDGRFAEMEKRIEKVETSLLGAFYGWARPMEIRVNGTDLRAGA
jgi:hypothetical protein